MFAQSTLSFKVECGQCEDKIDQLQLEQAMVNNKHYERYVACVSSLY